MPLRERGVSERSAERRVDRAGGHARIGWACRPCQGRAGEGARSWTAARGAESEYGGGAVGVRRCRGVRWWGGGARRASAWRRGACANDERAYSEASGGSELWGDGRDANKHSEVMRDSRVHC